MIYIDNITIKQDVYIPRTDGLGCVESSPYVTEAEVEAIVDSKMEGYTPDSEFSAHTADTSIHFTSAAVETQIQSALTPYYTSAQTDTAIQNALSGLDLSDYYTSAETDTAIQEAISEIPPVDLSDYYNSAQTDTAIQNATSGKVDTTAMTNYYTSAQTDQKLSAITSVIEEDEEVISRALNELHTQFDDYYTSAETDTKIQEAISSGVDLTNYYTSAQTDTKIAEATSGKVDTTTLADYYTSGETDTAIQNALSGIDLTDYYTSAQTTTAISEAVSGKVDSSTLDNYYTSAQTDTAISNATSGKVDTTALTHYYTSAETDTAITQATSGKVDTTAMTNYYTSAQTDSQISAATSGKQDTLVSGTNIKTINNQSLLGSGNIDIQGGGGGGSNVVELTQAQYDALVDPDPDTIYVITDAPTVDLSNFATSADVATLSADTATKATKANTTARSGYYFPYWNAEGIITGGTQVYNNTTSINGTGRNLINTSNGGWTIYAPTSAGTNGQILKSTGSGAPSWVSPNDAGIPTSTGILNIVACTQQEYDNMASHQATTLFVITD